MQLNTADKFDHPEASDSNRREMLEAALRGGDERILSMQHDEEAALLIFEGIGHVISDLDGTAMKPGEVELSAPLVKDMQLARSKANLKTTFLTGKPLSETIETLRNMPSDLDADVLAENGAYLVQKRGAAITTSYHLGSGELEGEAQAVRRSLNAFKTVIEGYGTTFKFIGAGRYAGKNGALGDHRILTSIDIVRPDSPEEGEFDRDAYKITNMTLLRSVYRAIAEFLATQHPEWEVTDLNNANYEIHRKDIHKLRAIEESPEFQNTDTKILYLCDSGNDVKAAQLRRKRKGFHVGVVHHERTPSALLAEADFATAGVARSDRFYDALLRAKRVPRSVFVGTNTGPFAPSKLDRNKLDVKVGMPVIISEFMREVDGGWICVGNEDFGGFPPAELHGLFGKILLVPVTEEEKRGHYYNLSNSTFWPDMHQPGTTAPVETPTADDWEQYRTVNRKVARALLDKVAAFKGQPENAGKNPVVWVQDYQLLAVKEEADKLINEECGDDAGAAKRYAATWGIMWHIPFSSPTNSKMEPEHRKQIVEWMSRYGLVSMHTSSYEAAYLETCAQTGVKPAPVMVHPISVNVSEIAATAKRVSEVRYVYKEPKLHAAINTRIQGAATGFKEKIKRAVCGVERGDPSKGVHERLGGWQIIVDETPEDLIGWDVFEVVTESREGLDHYRKYFIQAQDTIGQLNDKSQSRIGRKPFHHIERINEREDVIALLDADLFVSSTLMDGFNMSTAEAIVVMLTLLRGNVLMSKQMGLYEALAAQGMGDAINTFDVPTPENIAIHLRRALRNQLRSMKREELEKFFKVFAMQTWMSANIGELLHQALRQDYRHIATAA
jgi:trehalose 6-phosphate synthase